MQGRCGNTNDMNDLARRPVPHMTADDFLAWPGDGRPGKAQLFDGEVVIMPPASAVHGTIQFNLAGLLHAAPRGRLTSRTEGAVRPQIGASMNVRVPDILGTFEQAARGQQTAEQPVLVIEILSPGNEDTARENLMAYATIPSVQELVVVHSTRVMAEILVRGPDGAWPANPHILGAGDTLDIISANLHCPIEALYAGTWLA